MDELNPALVAVLDQSMAAVDERVARFVEQIGDLIAQQGRQGALVQFSAWLRAQDLSMDVVATLATGALIGLAEQPSERRGGHPDDLGDERT